MSARRFYSYQSHTSTPSPVRLALPTRTEDTHLRLLPLLEEGLFPTLILFLLPRKISLLAHLLHRILVDTLQIHLYGRCDDIARIDPPQRNAIDFERTGDQEDALREVFEEYDALAAETAGEEDEDSTGHERRTWTGGFDRFADLVQGRDQYRGLVLS